MERIPLKSDKYRIKSKKMSSVYLPNQKNKGKKKAVRRPPFQNQFLEN
jgi:hypothetical protein